MKRGQRLLFVACVLSLPGGCARQPRSGDGAADIRVLVYNIHAGKDAAGVDNIARVAGIVKRTAADVVLLQEVDRLTTRSGTVDQVAVLDSLTGFHAAFGKTLDYQGGQYGIAILSRWPIETDTLIHLPINPPQERAGGSYEPRGALRVVIGSPYGKVGVLNTHLDPSRDDSYRRQEIPTFLLLLSQLADESLAIGGGDLNSEPESAILSIVRSAGFTESWSGCGMGKGLSYPADKPVKRIDYLVLSKSFRCVSARVIETQASDHRPVLFVIRQRADSEQREAVSCQRVVNRSCYSPAAFRRVRGTLAFFFFPRLIGMISISAATSGAHSAG